MYWDKWTKDEWDDAYDELQYEDQEVTDADIYFDVPLPYHPVLSPQINKLI